MPDPQNRAAPITSVATTDISRMLHPQPPGRRMPMRGFDEEFVDIADYIIRITDRIWHERKIDLCHRYYAADSMIHTLAGDIVGADVVEANTHATLAAFPDRTLDGDNVIWAGNEDDGYYSSHLITSKMTNLGPSEFGPATGRHARIRTIADCVCKENLIVEEWLMRDNAGLVLQLGLDPHSVALDQAKADRETGTLLTDYVAPLIECTRNTQQGAAGPVGTPEENIEGFVAYVFGEIWGKQNLDALPALYDFRVGAHLTANRDLYGTKELSSYFADLFSALSDISVTVDHVASIPYLGAAKDVAVRWSLAATHNGDGLFGPATGAPIYILGASHWRLINGRIREEWTVFDEVALLRQIASHRLAQQ
ncbi:MAG: ester cyclase [Pseudomonadota bacterium]